MSTKTEGQHTGEFVVTESPGHISRDTVTVTVGASTTLAAGLVLGKITATSKYVPYANGASDGSEVAAAVLYDNVVNADVAPADIDAVVINQDAEVRAADLQWKSGQVDADKAAGLVDLLTKGIKAR